jgi:hypothetical protein
MGLPRAASATPQEARNNRRTGFRLDAAPMAIAPHVSLKEAMMEEYFVWMATRQIRPGTVADSERSRRPGTHPEGMLRAYAYWSENGRKIVGISFWA